VNNITNINDFPDYYFLTVCSEPMNAIFVIKSDGIIGNCYKFSDLNVYAIKKSDFNESYSNSLMKSNRTAALEYFNSLDSIKVIESVWHHETVSFTSPTQSIYNEYIVDINKLKIEPDKTVVNRSNIFYFYIILPLVALILIIFLIIRKKNAAIN
jgi:hypothetical protein